MKFASFIWSSDDSRPHPLNLLSLVLYITIIGIFIYLISGVYFKPPWAEDHLTYTLMANTRTFAHFYYWNGAVAERLSVLYILRLFTPFFADPATASMVAHSCMHIALIFIAMLWLHRKCGLVAGALGGGFLVFTLIQLRAHATEVLADPYATLFILFALIAAHGVHDDSRNNFIRGTLCGISLWAAVLCKTHYAVFVALFGFPLFWSHRWRMLAAVCIGILAGGLLYVILFSVLYPAEFRIPFLKLIGGVYSGYVKSGGRGASASGPFEAGWALIWLNWFMDWRYVVLPFIFLPLFPLASRDRAAGELLVIGGVFVLLCFLLACFTTFPTNHMYAFTGLVFLALGAAAALGSVLEVALPKGIPRSLVAVALIAVFVLSFFAGCRENANYVDREKFTTALMCLTVIMGVGLSALAFSRPPSIWPVVLLALVLAGPQTYLLTRHDYTNFRVWRHTYDELYNAFHNVDTQFIRNGPILAYFSKFGARDRNEGYILTMIATKVFPCADIIGIYGTPERLPKSVIDNRGRRLEGIITDSPEVIRALYPEFIEVSSNGQSNSFPNVAHFRNRSSQK